MLNYKHPPTKRLFVVTAIIILVTVVIGFLIIQSIQHSLFSEASYVVGQPIDSLNGIKVYYNGETEHVEGKNYTTNGYNLGLQWQCVEFVKRYYFERFGHQMPVASGNANDFFNNELPDASYNYRRELVQYSNPSLKKPEVDDIIVFDKSVTNKYGHIAIVSKVSEDKIEIIQQNAGPENASREEIKLIRIDGKWKVAHKRALGWMRIE